MGFKSVFVAKNNFLFGFSFTLEVFLFDIPRRIISPKCNDHKDETLLVLMLL